MKKAFSLLVALSLCLSLCACSQKNEAAPAEEPVPVEESPVGLPNPMTETTTAALVEETGLNLDFLSGCENVRFFKYDTDPVIAEGQFTYEGRAYSWRMATPAAETDISGMHYSTLESVDTLVGYSDAKLRKGDCGCDVSWYDMAPGVQYCLSCADAAAAEGITDLAVKLYHPTQGNVGGELDADFAPQFQSLLMELHQGYFPGTAGSSLNAARFAAALADLFTEQQPTAETLTENLALYASTLDADEQVNLAAQLLGVRSAYENLRDYGVDVLADAGATAAHYPWNTETMNALFTAMSTEGSRYAYARRLEDYHAAMKSGKTRQELVDAGLNFMVGDLTPDTVGYAIEDIDGDGVCELLLCPIADNDYLRALVLELDTVDMFGFCSQVFMSGERDRLYTCEADIFLHEGSSGAADSFSAFEQYADGALTELSTDAYTVTQRELTPLVQRG